MRAYELRDEWDIDHLRLVTRPEPRPGPGEVQLRMKAASLNFRDLFVLERGYGAATGTLPLVPCCSPLRSPGASAGRSKMFRMSRPRWAW